MIQETTKTSYIYTFKYDYHHSELCKLESRQIFETEENNEFLFSNIQVDPSISPFIKNRIDILSSSESYSELIKEIKRQNITIDGFKVEYVVLDGDATDYPTRLNKLKDVGFSIEGDPDYKTPSIIYTICCYQGIWYFGLLLKNNIAWKEHKKKPCSFSNSIGMHIAKTLVSIASQGNQEKKLLDACCGVGTVMLEACFANISIAGCDVNPKACRHTRENLSHYNYIADVYCSDIKYIEEEYDAAIIDLPYNLYSYSDEANTLNIIQSTAKITKRVIIVSIVDIAPVIKKTGLKIADFCTVEKRGRSTFTRNIWVCERYLG